MLSEAEGAGCGWTYSPGQKGNAREIRKLARARRARVAEMASDPAAHRLVLTIAGNESFIGTIRSRLSALYRRPPGTLAVPDFPSVPHCVFRGDPQWSDQKRIEDGYLYDITVELMEL